MARRIAVPNQVLDLELVDRVGYRDAYIAELPTRFRAELSADALTGLAFGGIAASLRWFIATTHRHVLRLELDLPSTVPVPGWRRLRDEPGVAVYGADGELITIRLVVSVESKTVRVCTLVQFNRPVGRAVWTMVGPVHRLVARTLLDRGVDAAGSPDPESAGT